MSDNEAAQCQPKAPLGTGCVKNHPHCADCKKELKARWDCPTGDGFPCRECRTICEDCCKKVPKMDWEQFHNKYIEKFHPTCHGCGSELYESEGFVQRFKGKIIGFCSHSCWDDHGNIGQQLAAGHPPVELLESETHAKILTGVINFTINFTMEISKETNTKEAKKRLQRALKSLQKDFPDIKVIKSALK